MSTIIDTSLLRVDGGTQSRAALSEDIVTEYALAMSDGATFPPVVVFYDGSHYWVADGFHRVAAYVREGTKSIDCDVRQGAQRDAILFSVGANVSHGLRRTNADKRRSVETLLRDSEWVQWSDREIAKRCGVHGTFVGALRSSLQPNSSERRVTTKHGTEAVMNTAKIGKRTAASDPLPAKVTAAPIIQSRDVDDFDPGPEPHDDECVVADADAEPVIVRERPTVRRWGEFELASAVALNIRRVQSFRDELKSAFDAVEPAYREEFASRLEPTLLAMFVDVRERLPLTARRVEENRAQMRVIEGGK